MREYINTLIARKSGTPLAKDIIGDSAIPPSYYRQEEDLPLSTNLPTSGVITTLNGGLGDQFKRIIGGLQVCSQLKLPLYVVYDIPSICHYTHVTPLFPKLKCLTIPQLRSTFPEEVLPSRELDPSHLFTLAHDNLGSYLKGDIRDVPGSFFREKKQFLVYKQNQYSPKEKSCHLANRVVEEYPQKLLYLFNNTHFLPPQHNFLPDHMKSFIPKVHFPPVVSGNSIAVHVRLGDRNPLTGPYRDSYPGTNLERVGELCSHYFKKGFSFSFFTDDPVSLFTYIKGAPFLKASTVHSSIKDPLRDLILMTRHKYFLDTGTSSGFLSIAYYLRQGNNLPYTVLH